MGLIHSLNFNFSPQNVEIHDKITGETVKWIFESGGFIFLEKKVTNPSEKISDDGHKPHYLILCGVNRINQNNEK